ncbi:MAG: flavodoxin family protein [Candidatus Harrisonbacteria bacterium]|nr:flavodoxin family protein [Candidatus Harrisonbacteria bacterium]
MSIKKAHIIGINGSPHKNGLVAKLLMEVLEAARENGAETQLVHLYDLSIIHEQGLYSEDPEKEVPANMPEDGITKIYPDLIRADGLVLATPVYWANMSGVMKDFIDHLTALENDNFKLEGKVAAFIAASKENEGGMEMAAISMVAALTQMGVLIPPWGIMWAPGGSITAKEGHPKWANEDASHVGKTMVRLINLFKKNKVSWY